VQTFCSSYDLDLDPMTLICELDRDILKMRLHTKIKLSMVEAFKTQNITDRQTDRQIDTQTDATKNTTAPHFKKIRITGRYNNASYCYSIYSTG